MALVQTDGTQDRLKTSTTLLRGALSDELSATNLYEKLMDLLPDYRDILEEIRNDEINHQGRLMQLILEIDPSQIEYFEKGMKQED